MCEDKRQIDHMKKKMIYIDCKLIEAQIHTTTRPTDSRFRLQLITTLFVRILRKCIKRR